MQKYMENSNGNKTIAQNSKSPLPARIRWFILLDSRDLESRSLDAEDLVALSMKDERRSAGDQMEGNFEVIQDNVPMGLCLKIIDWCSSLYRVINVQQAVRDKDG